MDELRDHLEDLKKEGWDMANQVAVGRRMGTPYRLAAQAAEVHRGTSWVRRHPALTFVLAPLPAALLAAAVFVLLLAGAGYVVAAAGYGGGLDAIPRSSLAPIVSACAIAFGFVPPLAAAAAFGWLAARHRISGWWLAAAALQFALIGGVLMTHVVLSDIPGKSQVQIGAGFPPGGRQVAQLLVPMAVAGICFRAAQRRAAATA